MALSGVNEQDAGTPPDHVPRHGLADVRIEEGSHRGVAIGLSRQAWRSTSSRSRGDLRRDLPINARAAPPIASTRRASHAPLTGSTASPMMK